MSDSTPRIQGELTAVQGDTIEGWARIDGSDRVRPFVEIIDGDANILARARAARFSKILLEKRIGDGFHGFRMKVPSAAFVRQQLTVRARVESTDTFLPGGPLQVRRALVLNHNISRLMSDSAFREHLVTPNLWLKSGDRYHEDKLTAFSPEETVDFTGDVYGDGWITTANGSRVDESGRGTIRFLRLPARKSQLTISMIGQETAAAMIRIKRDETFIDMSIHRSKSSNMLHLTAPLPAAETIITPVAISILASPEIFFISMSMIYI